MADISLPSPPDYLPDYSGPAATMPVSQDPATAANAAILGDGHSVAQKPARTDRQNPADFLSIPPPAPDAPPSSIDIATGRKTTIPEATAWGAFQTLKANPKVLDEPQPDGTTLRARLTDTVSSYYDERKANNQKPFPTYAAEAVAARNAHHEKLFSGLDKLDAALTPEQKAALDDRAKLAPDPDAYRARAINFQYLRDLDTPVTQENYPIARSAYAVQLGLPAEADDKALYNAIGNRQRVATETTKTLSKAIQKAMQTVLMGDGRPEIREQQLKDLLAATPDEHKSFVRQQFTNSWKDARDLARQAKPVVDQIMPLLLEGANAKEGSLQDTFGSHFEKAGAMLPADQPGGNPMREAVLAQLEGKMKAINPEDYAGFSRFYEALAQGTGNIARGTFDMGVALRQWSDETAKKAGMTIPGTDTRENAAAAHDDARKMRNLTAATAGSFRRKDDGFIRNGLLSATESVPYTLLAFEGPAGFGLMTSSMGGQSFQDARQANPNASPARQAEAALVSGALQAVLETVFDHAGLRMAKMKVPGLFAALNKTGVTNATGRAAITGTAAALGILGTEYTEEFAQQGTDRALQDMALSLSGIDPTTNWKGFFHDWNPLSGSQVSMDTLGAVLPYALIGGGVASFQNYRFANTLQRSTPRLRSLGIPEERVQAIATAPTLEDATTELRSAWRDGLDLAAATKQREKLSAIAEETVAFYGQSPIQVIQPENNDFTGETQFQLNLPDAPPRVFQTLDEAFDALRDFHANQLGDDLDTLNDATRQDLIDFMTGEYSAAANIRITDRSKLALTPDQAVKQGIATQQQMTERLRIHAMQEGVDVADLDLSTLRIHARRFSERMRDGSLRQTVEYFQGADPINVAEDIAETYWTSALDEGLLKHDEIVGWIRQAEQVTGNSYLDPSHDSTSDRAQLQLTEALSAFSREYLAGNVADERLPEKFRRWLHTLIAYAAHKFRHAATLLRSKPLMDAVKAGKIDSRFVAHIADSVGLNQAETDRRFQKDYQAQLAAEAMGGVEEISEAARGMLPHPETARQRQHPLAGELQRLYDSLKTPTRRRRKDGSTIDSTQRANAFFLPIGEWESPDDVRQSLNEKGFAFDTPAALLSALDDSLNYNLKSYATQGGMLDQSFSVGSFQTNEQARQAYEKEISARLAEAGIQTEFTHIEIEPGKANTVINYYRDGQYLGESIRSISAKEMKLSTIGLNGKTGALRPIYAAESQFSKDHHLTVRSRLSNQFTRAKFNEFYPNSTEIKGGKTLIWSPPNIATQGGMLDQSFSVGRTNVFPTAGTRSIQTTDGRTLVGPATFSISAYHGTPHKVDRFSLDRIGTGEGAQAYGWGLYFAGNPNVAKAYARAYARGEISTAEDAARLALSLEQSPASAIEALKALDIPGLKDSTLVDDAVRLVELGAVSTGNLYTVTLDVNDEDLLDWDKPFSEQPESLRKAFAAMTEIRVRPYGPNPYGGEEFADVEIKLPGGQWSAEGAYPLEKAKKRLEDKQSIIDDLRFSGESIYDIIMRTKRDAAEVSQYLNDLGVPGIRYLDGNSRAQGQGSSNYVLFDESKIQITEENGKPVTMADQSFSIGPVMLPPTTKKSRTLSDPALAPHVGGESGLMSFDTRAIPTLVGNEEDATSFSLGRARENFFAAQNRLLTAKEALTKEEKDASTARYQWEIQHGKQTVDQYPRSPKGPLSNVLIAGNKYNRPRTNFGDPDLEAWRKHLSLPEESTPQEVVNAVTQKVGREIFGFAGSSGDRRSIRLVSQSGQLIAEIPGTSYQPFPEPESLIAAREALAQAEADLYLAEEEFDPETDARLAIADRLREKELAKKAAMFAALLDARDDETRNAASYFVAKVWAAYGSHDKVFQYGKTESSDADDIAAAVSTPGKLVTATESGDSVRFSGPSGHLTIHDADTDQPHIEALAAGSKGKKAGGGSQLYAAALDWIHNNGKRIKDDPGGLTAINHVRRTSNFLASAIRWGTTKHLMPHKSQAVGKWTKNDVLNTALLATKELDNVLKLIPSARALRFDFQSGSFFAGERLLTDADLEGEISNHNAGDQGVGISTLQRAIITASAIQEFQRGTASSALESAESGLPDSLTGVSYSLSASAIGDLEKLIAQKLTEGPAERAQILQTLRNRLAGVLQRQEDITNGVHPLLKRGSMDPVQTDRLRQRELSAQIHAIISAFPPEVRGKVNFDSTTLLDADGPRSVVNAMKSVINRLDEALEPYLQEQYLDALAKLIDLGSPVRKAGETSKSKLTPETQRTFDLAVEATRLTPTELSARLIGTEATIAELSNNPDADGKELVRQTLTLNFLETFGALHTRSAAELEHAHQQLLSIYSSGRMTRRILDDAQREERAAWRKEILESLGLPYGANDHQHTTGTSKKGLAAAGEMLQSLRLGMSSFHQVMEWILPKSTTARMMQAEERKAATASTRLKLEAHDRFNEFFATRMGLKTRRQRNAVLARLSERKDTDIRLLEGIRSKSEKLTIEQAQRVLRGQMNTGWENDRIAMESLRQAYAEYQLLPKKNRDAREFIRFDRVTQRGNESPLVASQLELLNYHLTAQQAEYLPALDKWGFTEDVLAAIKDKLEPETLDLAEFLATEYADGYHRLNPVHRAITGMDMPQIRNYSPGRFENAKGSANDALDAFGSTLASPNALAAGFTKNRKAHMARPQKVSALASYWGHVATTSHFIAYAELCRDMGAAFKTPEIRRAIEARFGKKIAGTFSQWLDAIALDGQFQATVSLASAEIGQRALAGQAAIGLAYNLGVLLKQASAGLGFLMEMPLKDAAKGLMLSLSNPQALTKLWNTETIRQRIDSGFSPEDRQLLTVADSKPSLILDLLAVGRLPIAWTDAAMTTISGSVAYQFHRNQALKQGLNEQQAEEIGLAAMDRVIFRTAQPNRTAERSLDEITTAHPFMRTLFQFKSDPRQKFALATEAIAKAIRGDITKGEAAKKFLVTWALYGLMAQVAADVWKGISRDDDDNDYKNWQPKDYLAAMIAGPIAGVTYLGSAADFLIHKLITGKAFTNSATPIEGALAAGLAQISKASSHPEKIDFNDIVSLTRSLGLLATTIDPRAAIVPVALKAARDTYGIAENAGDVFFGESPAEQMHSIIREAKAADKKAKETAPPKALTDRQLARKKVLDELNPQERSLKKLPEAIRKDAIEKILQTLPENERESYKLRLQNAGL